MPRKFSACKKEVYNRGVPPTAFLNELLDWAVEAPDEIFEENDRYDIYSSVSLQLGPYLSLANRKAVMLEVLRVLGGFESSWNWTQGVDTTNPNSKAPCSEEAGLFQCSGDAMDIDPSLKAFMKETSGKTDCKTFITLSKSNHQFAIEFCARLLRFTTTHHGPIKKKKIHRWLSRAAMAEFQGFLSPVVNLVAETKEFVLPHPTITTPNGRDEIEAMFGNPANNDGTLNEAWEGSNIRKVPPPDGWQLFYQDDKLGIVPVSGIRMHKLLADVFTAGLDEVWQYAVRQIGGAPSTATVRAWLHDRRLDQHGGGFNYRPITGGTKLSLHSYGIAIDWDPDHNPRQKPLTRTLPDWWYDIWTNHGWHDGRKFPTPDPMHVQFATGA